MFGVHSPVGCGQSRLDVSRDGVEPFEGRLFGGLRAATRLNLSVRASGRCDGGEQAGASDAALAPPGSAVLASLPMATLRKPGHSKPPGQRN